MTLRRFLFSLAAVVIGCCFAYSQAEYSVSAIGNVSTGDFAPYLIGSLRHGKLTQKGSALLDGCVTLPMDPNKRFSWGAGVELITGYSHENAYDYWNADLGLWETHNEGPAPAWVQQCYGEIKYRSVFLTMGLKEHSSALLNPLLSSGDFVESGNARPILEARVGFLDFQDIPFTNGWVQIQGEVSYGRMLDDTYLKHHYNYYNYHIHLKSRYSYRRCYFRTNPHKPLSVTVGMQIGSFFAGYADYYKQGVFQSARIAKESFWAFFKVLIPMGENGEDYYEGSSVGCWDFNARYQLPGGQQLKVYFQGPWEDGSGIGRLNKFDGIWGIEYKSAKPGLISGAVFEYLEFRDQSGPIHWAPGDMPGTTVSNEATGCDDYYNNYFYNSYANYGMSIGTPFLLSPIYNLDGYLAFTCNRTNGFHIGVMGNILPTLDYRFLASHQRGLGTYRQPFYHSRHNTSFLLEGTWNAARLLQGLSMKLECAIDRGALRGNNFGMALTLSYSGKI